MMTLDTL